MKMKKIEYENNKYMKEIKEKKKKNEKNIWKK